MILENKQSLFASPLLRIDKVCCLRARRDLSCEECKTEHQISIPLSGVNVRQIGGKSYTISPSHATLSNRGEEYRVGHPFGSGEIQLNIVLQDTLLMELLCTTSPEQENHPERPFIERQLPIAATQHFAVQLLMAATKSGAHQPLELEETTIAVVARLLGRHDNRARALAVATRDWELAQQAQAILASCYAQPIALQELASNLATSVYHLCRVFRRTTNTTLWSRVQQLRARAALIQLADGERDLTALGLALGYSHHSHFTAAFRREVGLTPSAARRVLTTASLSQARELLAH
jgi:AraC family transcriptional regulator